MRPRGVALGALVLSMSASCASVDVEQPSEVEWEALRTLSPEVLPAPPPDVSNRFADSEEAAALGQRLFFDLRFSGRLLDGDNDGSAHALGEQGEPGRVACAGCHVASDHFSDTRTLGGAISLAAGWGRRRAPSLLDVGQAVLVTWDGRRDTLYNQVFGPLESPVEMNSSRLFVAQQMHRFYRAPYEALFGAMPPLDDATRFPQITPEATGCTPSGIDTGVVCEGTLHGMPGDQAEFDGLSAEDQDVVTEVVVNFGKAIGAYERLLACGPSPFDAWVRGDDDAISIEAQRGARLFVGRAGCVACHSGPHLSDQRFHNVGLRPTVVAVAFIDENDEGAAEGLTAAIADPLNVRGVFSDGDDGRLPERVDEAMRGAFRTPTLRCVAERPSFMHTGQLTSLEDVVEFFAEGGDEYGYPGTREIGPIELSDEDRSDLVAFLESLSGEGPPSELLGP